MNLKIAARMIAVLAIGSAMIATVVALREHGTEGAAPAQNLRDPGGEPASAELVRCRDLGMAAASDAACKRVWAENRRRFFGSRELEPSTTPAPERFGPELPSVDEPPRAPVENAERLHSGDAGVPDAKEAPAP